MSTIPCPLCGAANLLNARYCNSCGREINKPEVTTQPAAEAELEPKQRISRANLFGIVAGICAFFLVMRGVQQFTNGEKAFETAMVQTASELNKSCPIMVDQATRLDNVVAMPDKTFQYNYTLVNLEKKELNIDTMMKYLEPTVINIVKTSPEMKQLREHQVTFLYNYRDKSGVFLHKIKVTPDMYE